MTIDQAIKILKTNKTFLLSIHENPDPDALSSQLALGLYLKSIGKKVHIINADKVPQRLSFLPGTNMVTVYKQGMKLDYDVAVTLDCGALDRIAGVTQLIKKDKIFLNIDHHITNKMFGTHNLVIPEASSTAEVVYDIITQAGMKLNKNIATALYIGILTDTGSFRYDNTSSHTHKIVSHLLTFGLPVSLLYQQLYENVTLSDLKYFTKVVGCFDVLYKGQVVCVELKKKVFEKFSENFDLRDKIFKYLRSIQGVEVIVILTENDKGSTRVNLRSQQRVNVGRIASYFKGGGHKRASGCLIKDAMPGARKKILEKIEKAI